jgi:uncharacterized protein
MTKLRKCVVFVINIAVWVPVACHAASFECGPYLRERACPELVICSTPELSDMDDRLGAAYELQLRQLPTSQVAAFRKDQRDWIASRHQYGCDASCIGDAYRSRLGALEGANKKSSEVDLADLEGNWATSSENCAVWAGRGFESAAEESGKVMNIDHTSLFGPVAVINTMATNMASRSSDR